MMIFVDLGGEIFADLMVYVQISRALNSRTRKEKYVYKVYATDHYYRAGRCRKLAYEDVAVPQPKADEVLVKVYAFGINRPDILQRQGLYPMPKGVTPVPGLEVAGEVVAIGEDVSLFKLGDKVCGLTNGGGYAEYCVVPESQTITIPDAVSFVQAAAIPETFFTVWANVFQMAHAKAGETLLVHGGASGIGTTALMLAQSLGLKKLCDRWF